MAALSAITIATLICCLFQGISTAPEDGDVTQQDDPFIIAKELRRQHCPEMFWEGELVAHDISLKIDSTIYTTGAEVRLDEGPHTFECLASNTETDTLVSWDFNGESVAADSSMTLFREELQDTESTITNRQISGDDCGIFVRCSAISTYSSTVVSSSQTVSVIMKVITPPEKAEIFVSSGVGSSCDPGLPCTSTTTLIHGIEYTFECKVTGASAEAGVTWTLTQGQSSTITEVDEAISSGVNCLRPTDVESMSMSADYAEHQGQTLTCVASNSVGSVNYTTGLNILVAPSMSDITLLVDSVERTHQETVVILAGDSMFQCQVTGAIPSADISWTIAGVTSFGSTTTRTITANTTARCLAYNSVSLYTGGPVAQEVNIVIEEPQHCYEILHTHGRTTSGKYWIYPVVNGTATPMQVWCDMNTDGGGWTVFQRRVNGSVDFWRGWDPYKNGFGDLSHEHWLGLDNIYAITNNGQTYKLRLDLNDGLDDEYALYSSFTIMDEENDYTLDVGGFTMGGAGDGMADADGQAFTTRDVDNDMWIEINCGVYAEGGWWYNDCYEANLNGQYLKGRYTGGTRRGLEYIPWKGIRYALEGSEMKLRPEPQDCYEILHTHGRTTSGKYWIYPVVNVTTTPMQVWCDMDTDGGGWTVFQRRVNGSVDFWRGWDPYKNGFGDLSHEHWLGLDNIYAITNNGQTYKLRLDLNDGPDDEYALYSSFTIMDEENDYTLDVGGFTMGGAGDGMADADGQAFTTRDVDNDNSVRVHCGVNAQGGWWYNDCYQAKLNGQYLNGPYTGGKGRGLEYIPWKGIKYAIEGSEMKLRPV